MDDARFDRLARLLGAAGTRRGALAGLLGAAFGGALPGLAGAAGRGRSRRDDADPDARRRRPRRCADPCPPNFTCHRGDCTCPTFRCGDACCPAGQVCQNGICAEVVACHAYGDACGDGIPCCDGLMCGSGFGGAPVGCWRTKGSPCAANEECGYGRQCKDGVCIVDPPPCNGECEAPFTCVNDQCVYATPRQVDAFGTLSAETEGSSPPPNDGTLSNPTTVALDRTGTRAWVADRLHNRILEWSRTGGGWSNVATLGSFGTGTGQMETPFGVAVSPAGTMVWIVDPGENSNSNPNVNPFNNRVEIWTPGGSGWSQTGGFGRATGSTVIGQTDGTFWDPYGIWVNPAGTTAFIADKNNNRVVVWTNSGGAWSQTASFGTFGNTGLGQTDGKMNKPRSVAVDAAGTTAWVSDSNNDRIVVWTSAGGAWRQIAAFGAPGASTGPTDGLLDAPFGVAVTGDGSVVWVADSNHDRIAVWTRSGATWVHADSFGTFGATGLTATDGQMNEPRGVTWLPGTTTVFVADSENGRITVWA